MMGLCWKAVGKEGGLCIRWQVGAISAEDSDRSLRPAERQMAGSEAQRGDEPCSEPLLFTLPPPLCSMPQDLSEALKEATKEVHVQAENAEFMKNFQKGQVTRKGFKVCGLVGTSPGGEYDRGVCVCPRHPGQWFKWKFGPGMLRDQMGMFKGIILQMIPRRLKEGK